ncbi:hypothetical protein EV361DRAFT_966865 [Lentinula raphanica]|nr:hypothetical protein EV361DRAFT_966865 [Lentinula raphanica]
MPRATKGNVPQRRKITREPIHPLLDDIDAQPRIKGLTTLTPNQRLQKNKAARREFVTRRITTTSGAMENQIASQSRNPDADDRVFTEVLMDLDDGISGGVGLDSGGGLGDIGGDEDPSQIQNLSDWVEEDASVEEQLLYFRTKDALEDFEMKGRRCRKSRIILDQARWEEQMPELVEAYMDFCHRRFNGSNYNGQVKERHLVQVWTSFGCSTKEVPVFYSDRFHNTSYIRSGFIPFNPLLNASMVSLETMELYHHLFMRCPRLGIQPFVRAISDLQGIPYKNHISVQFSTAYDLYSRIRLEVRGQVLSALDRATPNWRMLNNCPCCQYEVQGEPDLPIRMMIAIDGNNSLKRFQRREAPTEDGQILGAIRERPDGRIGGGDYFLQPEEVDRWDEPQWKKNWPEWTPKEKGEKVPCADRWSNMNEAKTKRSFGFFDINGIFGGFCRHSFVIVFLDMIRTGEQSKYMLALLHHFMSSSLEDRKRRGLPEEPNGSLAVGYDIACGMVDKIIRSPLHDIAQNERLQMVIGLLHGYAHNRLCQLSFLMLYINGAGIEDLEVCERYFSQSNALAPVTRYMSKFRRRQAIANYAYHRDNLESYPNLSRFIHSNYKQALSITNRSRDTAKVLRSAGILDPEIAVKWLDEEREFLESRQETPEGETLTAGYYQSLVKLAHCQDRLRSARQSFRLENGLAATTHQDGDGLYLTERQMANEQEVEAKLLADVQTYEERLGLRRDQRWVKGSEEWRRAEDLVYNARYQKALDRLEGLIVQRIFELSRMNVSGTGYKMRQHIGNAMKKRSNAILKALEDYNQAAAVLQPPRKLLSWEEVMNYTYLSEFDFLRDTRTDIREKPWAQPAVREAMSELFKLIGARQELDRLHVEIKRLLTYMKEEEEYLTSVRLKVQVSNPPLAYQIRLFRNERQRFNKLHRSRLNSIPQLKGFSSTNAHFFQAGVGVRRQNLTDGDEDEVDHATSRDTMEDLEGSDNDDDDDDDDEAEADVDERTEAVLGIAND